MKNINMNKKLPFKNFFKTEFLIIFINLNKLKYTNAIITTLIHNHSSPIIKKKNIKNKK